MAINIFVGARRIAILLGGVAVITMLVALNQGTYWSATYSLAAPNAPFSKVWFSYFYSCLSKGREIILQAKPDFISGGEEVHVFVCLEPMTFRNENRSTIQLIPYQTDADGTTWGTSSGGSRFSTYISADGTLSNTPDSDSSELTTYITQVGKRFTIEEAEIMWLGRFAEAMVHLAAGLAIFGALVWIIGWIVRGLLGIPRGMDKRPDLSPQTLAPAAGATIDIIKSEKLKQYSVADELLKWAKLKEDGHITEEEFNEARKKLLKQN